jgi:hypothetical protein
MAKKIAQKNKKIGKEFFSHKKMLEKRKQC